MQAGQVSVLQQPAVFPNSGSVLDKLSLKGKVVIVTGGARGLNNAMLTALCQAGASGAAIIDVLDIGEEAAKNLATEYGIPVVFHKVDVTDHAKLNEAVDSIAAKLGHIDVLIAGAALAHKQAAVEYPPEDFLKVLNVNVGGVFFTAQAVARHMIAQKTGGSIIAIGSLAGHITVKYPQEQAAYNSSKAAVVHLCKHLAAEWAPHKIRVNCITPGYMDTEMTKNFPNKQVWYDLTPMGRTGDVSELNGAAVYFASDASSFATGSEIVIDGGYTIW